MRKIRTISLSLIWIFFIRFVETFQTIQTISQLNKSLMEAIQTIATFLIFCFLIYKYLEIRDKIKSFNIISKYRNNVLLTKGISADQQVIDNALQDFYKKEIEEVTKYLADNEMKNLSKKEIEKIVGTFYKS